MNKSSFLLIIGLLLFLVLTPQSFAEIYKWVDKEGNVHYGQIPPGEDTQKIGESTSKQDPKTPPPSQDKTSRINQLAEELEKDQQKATEAKTKAAEEEKRQAMKIENCKRSQTNFNTINQGGRMYEVDPSGERHYWSDSERAAKLSNAQADVDKWCGED